jgi:hypothetical protein
MPVCGKCGKEVRKLTKHINEEEPQCVKCASDTALHPLDLTLLDFENEKRASLRIPLFVEMDFIIHKFMHNDTKSMRYPAQSIDISMTGICFTWGMCEECNGHVSHGVHENCLFYPYYIANKKKVPLHLELRVMDDYILKTDAWVVHVTQEENINMEFIGACFTGKMKPIDKRIIENLVIKYADREG